MTDPREVSKEIAKQWFAKVEEVSSDGDVFLAATTGADGLAKSLTGTVREWVKDGVLPILRDVRTYLEALTAAQARGTELQDEVRSLRRVLTRSLRVLAGVPSFDEETPQFKVLTDLLKVRWKGDAKYGGAEQHAALPLNAGNVPDALEVLGIGNQRDRLDALARVRAMKVAGSTGHADWSAILVEEILELFTAVTDERLEEEAIDVANVCLKMVEARRIARAKEATESKKSPAVVAIVRGRDGNVLAVRTATRWWHLPGGKVEEGEEPVEALDRELRQETGLVLKSASFVNEADHGGRRVLFYEVSACEGTPQPQQGDGVTEVGWISVALLLDGSEFGALYHRAFAVPMRAVDEGQRRLVLEKETVRDLTQREKPPPTLAVDVAVRGEDE